MMIDIYSRKIVGWEVHESESAEYSSLLVERTILREGVDRSQLVLHSDNGGGDERINNVGNSPTLRSSPIF